MRDPDEYDKKKNDHSQALGYVLLILFILVIYHLVG